MKNFLVILLCSSVPGLFAQTENTPPVVASGRVYNSETKEPVNARIIYQSLPYGNRMGVLNGNSFTFPLFDNERYSITVEAVGYSSAKYLLDPAEAVDGKLVKDIELHHTTGNSNRKHAVGQVLRLENLIFEQGKSKIDPSSYQELDLLVTMMRENKSMVIQLEGHTDYLGDAEKNLKLSEQRVERVKDYLVSKGIHKNRILTKAYGGSMPLSRDDTPEAHRLNRRVEVRILQN